MVTASGWTVGGDTFSVSANIGDLLNVYGSGVYTLILWAPLNVENTVVSRYSIFVDDLPGATGSASVASQVPVSDGPPDQRHLEVKRRMLEIIKRD